MRILFSPEAKLGFEQAEQYFNRSSNHLKKLVYLLLRVTTVSVETERATEAMKAAAR